MVFGGKRLAIERVELADHRADEGADEGDTIVTRRCWRPLGRHEVDGRHDRPLQRPRVFTGQACGTLLDAPHVIQADKLLLVAGAGL